MATACLCAAPAGALTPELRDELQQRKGEILAFLTSFGAEALGAAAARHCPRSSHAGRATPVFAVAGHNGDVFPATPARWRGYLGEEQPFFLDCSLRGLDERSEPVTRVEDLAAYFADQIRAFPAERSPTSSRAFCAGGTICEFELARPAHAGWRADRLCRFVSEVRTPRGTAGRPSWRGAWPSRRRGLSQHARAPWARSLPWKSADTSPGGLEGHKARRARARTRPGSTRLLVRRGAVERATVAAVRR